jgi:hypothetical protein
MGGTNSYGAYNLDPEPYDAQYSGGLPGRLRAIMQQDQGQAYFQPTVGSGATSSGANSDVSLQGGLLGRLLALQAEPSRYEPLSETDGQAPSEPRGPNFRRLARVYITDRTPDGTDTDWPGQYLSKGDTSNSSAPEQTIKTAQLVLPGRTVPPCVPVSPPRIPLPAIPDWLRDAWPFMRRAMPGTGGGGNNGNECYEREDAERGRCYRREQDYAHWDFLQACLKRAAERRNLCVRNGGRFPPSEPPEWGPDDEEIWRNHGR